MSRIVDEDFGWLFKRNHQEYDLGIDGQIEVITGGYATGQMLACQIKCGKSFFKETNRWGYVYRGELKHFNYLANYPVPVIIVICDPDAKEAFWVRFEAETARVTEADLRLARHLAFITMLAFSYLKTVRRDPRTHGFHDLLTLRRLLTIHRASRNVDLNPGILNRQRLIASQRFERLLKCREITLVADERLNQRVLDRHRLTVWPSHERLDRTVYVLIQPADLRVFPCKIFVCRHEQPDKNLIGFIA